MHDAPVSLPKCVCGAQRIKIGNHKSAQSLRVDLGKRACEIELYASNMLNKIEMVSSEEELELFVVSNESLGFPFGAPLRETFMRANAHRFMPCPTETGPQLCAQGVLGQGFDDVIVVTKPIHGFAANAPKLFRVILSSQGVKLLSVSGSFDQLMDKETRFVLMRRNS